MEFRKDEDGQRHGDQNNGSLRGIHVLISETGEYITLHDKNCFANVIHSRILRWGDKSGLSEWAQYNHKVLVEEAEASGVRSRNVTLETRFSNRGCRKQAASRS